MDIEDIDEVKEIKNRNIILSLDINSERRTKHIPIEVLGQFNLSVLCKRNIDHNVLFSGRKRKVRICTQEYRRTSQLNCDFCGEEFSSEYIMIYDNSNFLVNIHRDCRLKMAKIVKKVQEEYSNLIVKDIFEEKKRD